MSPNRLSLMYFTPPSNITLLTLHRTTIVTASGQCAPICRVDDTNAGWIEITSWDVSHSCLGWWKLCCLIGHVVVYYMPIFFFILLSHQGSSQRMLHTHRSNTYLIHVLLPTCKYLIFGLHVFWQLIECQSTTYKSCVDDNVTEWGNCQHEIYVRHLLYYTTHCVWTVRLT